MVVTSGKGYASLAMEEDLKLLDEVVIKAYSKNKTINDLATDSARTFPMEEVNIDMQVAEVIQQDWQPILLA
ncbi:MAG: hypothetical protein IPN86_17820 [Saprospiraceae bacterium]|nr:hypothetical protein [Saprospiraceae bacterium]